MIKKHLLMASALITMLILVIVGCEQPTEYKLETSTSTSLPSIPAPTNLQFVISTTSVAVKWTEASSTEALKTDMEYSVNGGEKIVCSNVSSGKVIPFLHAGDTVQVWLTRHYTDTLVGTNDTSLFRKSSALSGSVKMAIPGNISGVSLSDKTTSATTISVKWGKGATGTNYVVAVNGVVQAIANVNISATGGVITGLEPNKSYTVSVAAYNAFGVSAYSAVKTVTTLDMALPIPTATDKDPALSVTQIPVYWMNVEGAEEYNIYWSTDATAAGDVKSVADLTDAYYGSIDIDGLTPGKEYTIWVEAVRGTKTKRSAPITASTLALVKPAPYIDPAKVSPTELGVKWDHLNGVTYTVYAGTGPEMKDATEYTAPDMEARALSRTFDKADFDKLEPNKSYNVWVKASIPADDTVTPLIAGPLAVTTLPLVAPKFVVTGGDANTLTVEWERVSSDVANTDIVYKAYIGTTNVLADATEHDVRAYASMNGVETHEFTGLLSNTKYFIWVKASVDYVYPAVVAMDVVAEEVTTAKAILGLNVAPNDTTVSSITPKWTNLTNPIADEYIVSWIPVAGGSPEEKVLTTGSAIDGLTHNTPYSIIVKAMVDGVAVQSETVTASTLKLVSPAPYFTKVPTTTAIEVKWDMIRGVTYDVWQGNTDKIYNASKVKTVIATAANINTANEHSATSLSPDTDYFYWIIAKVTDVKIDLVLPEVMITTKTKSAPERELAIPVVTPVANDVVAAPAGGVNTSITLSWTGQKEEYYNIYWSQDPAVHDVIKHTTNNSVLVDPENLNYGYTITNLDPGTIYYIWVEAKFVGRDTGKEAMLTVETKLGTPVPVVTGNSTGISAIAFDWPEIKNAASYAVTVANSSGFKDSHIVDAVDMKVELSNLISGETYTVQVWAVSATGKLSDPSTEVSGSTFLPKAGAPTSVTGDMGSRVVTFPNTAGIDIDYQYAISSVIGQTPGSLVNSNEIKAQSAASATIWGTGADGDTTVAGATAVWTDIALTEWNKGTINVESFRGATPMYIYIRAVHRDGSTVVNSGAASAPLVITIAAAL